MRDPSTQAYEAQFFSGLLVEVFLPDILVLPETSLLVFQVRPNAKLPSKQENFVKISARKQSEGWRVCFFF